MIKNGKKVILGALNNQTYIPVIQAPLSNSKLRVPEKHTLNDVKTFDSFESLYDFMNKENRKLLFPRQTFIDIDNLILKYEKKQRIKFIDKIKRGWGNFISKKKDFGPSYISSKHPFFKKEFISCISHLYGYLYFKQENDKKEEYENLLQKLQETEEELKKMKRINCLFD
jgi:hypothetical protein